MKENICKFCKCLPAMALGTTLLLLGCTDNDYDFDQVDLTVGIGGNELLLPSNSTDTIKLSDILDLNNSETVIIKPNGEYVFEQNGANVEPARPLIDKILVAKQTITSSDLNIDLAGLFPNMAKAQTTATSVQFPINISGNVHEIAYTGDKPTEVVSLDWADVFATVNLNLEFSPMLSKLVPVIEQLTVELPRFMKLGNVKTNVKFEQNGSKITLYNVPTNQSLLLTEEIQGLDFVNGNSDMGQLVIDDGKIKVDGKINVGIVASGTYDLASGNMPTVGDVYIRSHIEMSDFEIRGAVGKFSPKINLDNLGSVNITGIPQFLTDEDVVLDLYNPQIQITLSNDMDAAGFISGTLSSIKDGVEIASVDIPEMGIMANATTKICICRNSNKVEGVYDVVMEVPNLSDLIRTIPDNILFKASARADETRTCSFELGKQYTIQPSYKIEAPIMFGEDAVIVYNDSIDDLNKDLKDIELSENSYITINSNIENRIPIYLDVKVEAIGVDGNVLNGIKVNVNNNIIASADGVGSVVTPVEILLNQTENGALKKLDKLMFVITGKAKSPDGNNSVVGKTLNSEKHFLIARDIEIKLVGKVITDLN